MKFYIHNHQLVTFGWGDYQNASFNKCYLSAPEGEEGLGKSDLRFCRTLKRLSLPMRSTIYFALSFPSSVLYLQSFLPCCQSLLIFSFISFCANFTLVCSKGVLLISSWDLRITFTESDLMCSRRVAKRWEVLKVGPGVFKTLCVYFWFVLCGKEFNLTQKDVWPLPSGYWELISKSSECPPDRNVCATPIMWFRMGALSSTS